MTLIWGTNYSIVKHAFAEMDPQAFNAMRMVLASAVFLLIIAIARRPPSPRLRRARLTDIFMTPDPMTRRDWMGIVGLGIVGHFFYQYFFIGGLARTTVANSSLMLAATPVVIALILFFVKPFPAA